MISITVHQAAVRVRPGASFYEPSDLFLVKVKSIENIGRLKLMG
jgi:hypothetical protein